MVNKLYRNDEYLYFYIIYMLALLLVKIIQVICVCLFFYTTEFVIYMFNYYV
jgi:hypothetical protein